MSKNIKFFTMIALQVVIMAAVIFVAVKNVGNFNSRTNHLRETANKLHAAGITGEAIRQYEKYLDTSEINPDTSAEIAFSIATLYEKEGKPEKALTWYYQVEGLNPKSKYATKASKKIVAILEKIGKTSAALMALNERSSLKKEKKRRKGAALVAKIGDKEFFDFEIAEELDRLGPKQRKQMESKEGKQKLLQKMVADELLYQKAIRLGMHEKDPYMKQIYKIKKNLLVQIIIQDEIHKKIKPNEKDIMNYYEQNKERFAAPAQYKIAMASYKTEKTAKNIVKKLRKGKRLGKLTKKSYKEEDVSEGGTLNGFTSKITQKAITCMKNNIADPLFHKGKYHVFQVKSVTPKQVPPFEKIKNYVVQSWQMDQGKKLYDQLLKKLLENKEVRIFTENIK